MSKGKREILKTEDARFRERLEYLQRDMEVIDQTISHIEDDLDKLSKQFKEIRTLYAKKEKDAQKKSMFTITMPKKNSAGKSDKDS